MCEYKVNIINKETPLTMFNDKSVLGSYYNNDGEFSEGIVSVFPIQKNIKVIYYLKPI